MKKDFAVVLLIMSYKLYIMGADLKCDHSGADPGISIGEVQTIPFIQ